MNMTRRSVVRAVVGGAVVSTGFGTGMFAPVRGWASLPPETFFAPTPADAINAVMGVGEAPLDPAVVLDVPGMVEVADLVPVSVKATLDNVESIAIVADKNPNPVIAYYRLDPRLQPYVATRVRLAESGDLHALVKADGAVHRATKNIEISISGCGDPEAEPGPDTGAISDRILTRIKKTDDGLVFRALMTHPMTPPRKDPATGRPVSGRFIQEVVAQLNGETVLSGDWSAGVAQNPYLSFTIRQTNPGDVIRLSWKDNVGNEASTEVTVS